MFDITHETNGVGLKTSLKYLQNIRSQAILPNINLQNINKILDFSKILTIPLGLDFYKFFPLCILIPPIKISLKRI